MRPFNRVSLHHAMLPNHAKSLVERLVQVGYLRFVSSTSSLAEGVHTPCKSSVFLKDGRYLDETVFMQASGRAGRRGVEDRGYSVVANLSHRRFGHLICSVMVEPKVGHISANASTLLRMAILLKSQMYPLTPDEFAAVCAKVGRMLKLPLLVASAAEEHRSTLQQAWKLQMAANLNLLHRLNLLTTQFLPTGTAAMVARMSYAEPGNLLLAFVFSRFEFWQKKWGRLRTVIYVLRILMASVVSMKGEIAMPGSKMKTPIFQGVKDDVVTTEIYKHGGKMLPTFGAGPTVEQLDLSRGGSAFNKVLFESYQEQTWLFAQPIPTTWPAICSDLFPLSGNVLSETFHVLQERGAANNPLVPPRTWKTFSALLNSGELKKVDPNIIGRGGLSSLADQKIVQLPDVCPFVSVSALAASNVKSCLPLLLVDPFLSKFDLSLLLRRDMETVHRDLQDQISEFIKVALAAEQAIDAKLMTHTQSYARFFFNALFLIFCGLANEEHRSGFYITNPLCVEAILGFTVPEKIELTVHVSSPNDARFQTMDVVCTISKPGKQFAHAVEALQHLKDEETLTFGDVIVRCLFKCRCNGHMDDAHTDGLMEVRKIPPTPQGSRTPFEFRLTQHSYKHMPLVVPHLKYAADFFSIWGRIQFRHPAECLIRGFQSAFTTTPRHAQRHDLLRAIKQTQEFNIDEVPSDENSDEEEEEENDTVVEEDDEDELLDSPLLQTVSGFVLADVASLETLRLERGLHVCMCGCMKFTLYVCRCMYVCMHVCMYVCMCVCM